MQRELNDEHWKTYMHKWWGNDLIAKAAVIQEKFVDSGGRQLHLEVYDTQREKRPTVVFVHGLVGYARLMLPFTVPLFDRGYNVVAPDLAGYGKTEGLKGDFTWNDWLLNVRDAVEYARARFGGPVVVAGASMGGPVAFSSAIRYQNVDSIICYCLWNLQSPEFIEGVVRFGRWSYFVLKILRAVGALIPRVRFRNGRLISYDNLTDSQELNERLRHGDPMASTLISIRGALSLITQSKWEIPPEQLTIPTLVFQPSKDRMTPPMFARRIFDGLRCCKRWVDFDGADHMTSKPHYFRNVWGPEVDRWLKERFSDAAVPVERAG
jgi:pimeloyl-ACP methyl ester carboxylesterase